MTNLRKSLQERALAMEINLPFMEGREKGEMKRLYDDVFTIIEYGFLPDPKKGTDYVCFVVAEDPDNFYFGGQVLTDNMKKFEDEGYHDEIAEEGLPVLFGSKKGGTSGNDYTTVQFYPEEVEEVKPPSRSKNSRRK